MDFIQLKIEKDSSITKYIKIIRKFDNSLFIKMIKQRIDENDFVTGFDLECYLWKNFYFLYLCLYLVIGFVAYGNHGII